MRVVMRCMASLDSAVVAIIIYAGSAVVTSRTAKGLCEYQEQHMPSCSQVCLHVDGTRRNFLFTEIRVMAIMIYSVTP